MRPTKYNEEMLAKAKEYLIDCPNEVPTNEGMAIYLGVSVKTLYNWAEAHDVFLHTFGEIQEIQKAKLIDNGLNGTFNSVITKLMLANHGMHDKQDNTLSAPGGGPLQVTAIERSVVDPANTDS